MTISCSLGDTKLKKVIFNQTLKTITYFIEVTKRNFDSECNGNCEDCEVEDCSGDLEDLV